MANVKVTLNGETHDIDLDRLTVSQLRRIQVETGFTGKAQILEALKAESAEGFQFLWWWAAERDKPFATVDFVTGDLGVEVEPEPAAVTDPTTPDGGETST